MGSIKEAGNKYELGCLFIKFRKNSFYVRQFLSKYEGIVNCIEKKT